MPIKPITQLRREYDDAPANARLPATVVAAGLCLSPFTLERHRSIGFGPKYGKAGRRVFYKKADVEAWLAKQEAGADA